MKKLIALFLVITFGFLNPTLSAEKLERREDTYARTDTRNWSFPLKELAGSAVFYVASSVLTGDLENIATAFSTGLLCDGGVRLGQNILEYFYEKTQSRKPIPNKKQKLHEQVGQARRVVSQIGRVVNLSVNVYMLYLLVAGERTVQGFVLTEVGYPLMIGIITAGTAYNVNEILYTKNTGRTRNDRPIARFANGLSQVLLGAYFATKHKNGSYINSLSNAFDKVMKIDGFRDRPDLIASWYKNKRLAIQIYGGAGATSWSWARYRFLQMHGDFEATLGIIQTVRNTVGYFSQSLRAEIKEIQKKSGGVARPKAKRGQAPKTSTPCEPVAQPVQSGQPQNRSQNSAQGEQKPKSKTKVKTRPADGGVSHPLIHEADDEEEEPEQTKRDVQRLEALEKIMNWSRQKVLDAAVVEEEINAVLRFYPTARSENLGHNMKSITLSFPNGATHQVKYEAAHNQRGEYQGDRKDRVLDALLVCYLSGWKEDKIKEFMDRHGRMNFWNVPNFLVRILWERGEIE
jgi:hypothetical protein